MKNSIIATVFFASLLSLSSTRSLAADDKYVCRSTCALIDASKSTLYTFGSVNGKSEVSTDEAFEVMTQECRNLATSKGFNGEGTSVIKGMVQVSSDKTLQSMTLAERSQSFRLGFILDFSRSRSRYSAQTLNIEDKFSYQVNFADDSSCGPYISNPNGKPKYIGSETPLG